MKYLKASSLLVSNKRFKLMMLAHLLWLFLMCALVTWWGKFLFMQASRIAFLERDLGVSSLVTQGHWLRTYRMVFWESFTFLGLFIICTIFLICLYWRDAIRSRGLEAFYASVTHELRTPLTSIRLQAESIAEHLSGEDFSQKLISRLMEDTLRLESQVERTLELARVEGGGPVHPQCLQFKPWLDRFLKIWSVDYLEKSSEKRDIHVNVEDILIQADPVAMQIIFKNLLENSVKHSKREKNCIRISTSMVSSQPVVQIWDNGQGYAGSTKDLGILFLKSANSQGTGVGLYLIKTLMKQMHGYALFENKEGFLVSLGFKEGFFEKKQDVQNE